MLIYLAGSMHGLKGYGKRWRDRETRWFKQYGVKTFSPPDREPEVVKRHNISPELLKTQSYRIDKATRIPLYQEIINFDLRAIRRCCDAVVVYFTKESAGTCSEITWAWWHGIPVYLVNASGSKHINPWVEACCTTVHSNFERLRNHLKVKYNLRKSKV